MSVKCTNKYLAHLGDDCCLPNVADVYDGLETATDALVVVQYADVGFKLEARCWLQTRTYQYHALHQYRFTTSLFHCKRHCTTINRAGVDHPRSPRPGGGPRGYTGSIRWSKGRVRLERDT